MKNTNSQPILCGTDFSENAKQATNVAAALAKRLSAPLRLVHASEIPASPVIQEHLHDEVRRLHDTGADITAEVIEGSASEVLMQTALQHAARLIVVSSLGKSAPTRWLLGSVAERTAESSPVPTLVVREAAPFEAWARGERALKVFVGADFTASSDAAMRWVAELRELGPIEVVAGYVDWPPEEAARLGIFRPLQWGGGNLPEMQLILERDLQEKVTRLLGNDHVSVQVGGNWGRSAHPLIGMAVESQSDLLVVGSHQRTGFDWVRKGSVSRDILINAPISVACVPTAPASRMAGPHMRKCLRVLVAVDLDEPHGFAAAYGYSIVNPGGTVRLVYNIPRIRQQPTDKLESAQLVGASEAKLRMLAPEKADAPDITTEVEVTENRETAEAICAAAERFGADIICIGSHTRPGFSAKVLGSVALAVLQTSRRPVLVVWPPTR